MFQHTLIQISEVIIDLPNRYFTETIRWVPQRSSGHEFYHPNLRAAAVVAFPKILKKPSLPYLVCIRSPCLSLVRSCHFRSFFPDQSHYWKTWKMERNDGIPCDNSAFSLHYLRLVPIKTLVNLLLSIFRINVTDGILAKLRSCQLN